MCNNTYAGSLRVKTVLHQLLHHGTEVDNDLPRLYLVDLHKQDLSNCSEISAEFELTVRPSIGLIVAIMALSRHELESASSRC
jgi:hypothetical protein